MFYEVRSKIFFDSQDEAVDFYHDCRLALDKGAPLNPDAPNREDSTISLLKNHHDEDPNAPCHLVAHSSTNNPV